MMRARTVERISSEEEERVRSGYSIIPISVSREAGFNGRQQKQPMETPSSKRTMHLPLVFGG
jgi:hypothetical protein